MGWFRIQYHIFFLSLTWLFTAGNAYADCPGKTITLTASSTAICGGGGPTNVTLTNNSTGSPLSGLWELFQNGSSIPEPAPGGSVVATLPSPGTYTFELTYDEGSCQDTATVIVIYATGTGPTASFTASATTICAGQNTTFTNTSTGSIQTYAWTFGNGNTASTVGPHTQTYPSAGTLVAQLTVSNACGSSVATQNITVNAGNSVSFTTNNDSFCIATPIVFNNTSTAAGPYTWNFGNGNTSSTASPTYSYPSAGAYTVTLTTSAPGACTNTTTQNIVILDTLDIHLSGNDGDGNTTNCLPYNSAITTETVNFNNTSTGAATSYIWDFGDGTSTVSTPTASPVSHTYNAYGVFWVKLTGMNGICNKTDSLKVIFGRDPKADFTVPGVTSGCVPMSVSPINNSQNGTWYVWDFGDIHIDTTTAFAAPSNTYTTGGGYTITLTVANFCDTDQTVFAPIIVAPKPETAFGMSPSIGCAPLLVNFTNQSVNYSPLNNFKWYFGDGATMFSVPFSNPVSHTYISADTFDVMLVAGNFCGFDTAIQQVIVQGPPRASFSVTPSSGCLPSSLTVNNLTVGSGNNYQWTVNGGNFGTGTTPTPGYLHPLVTTYVIKLTATNPCGSDDTTITLNFDAPTVANFTISDDSVCVGENVTLTSTSTGAALVYNWDFGNGNTSGSLGPHTQTYATSGVKTITLQLNGTCGPATLTKNIWVFDVPTASFTTNPNPLCQGQALNVNNTSLNGTSYAWTFQNGNPASSNLFNPGAIQFSASGPQNISLTVNNSGCQATSNSIITVNPKPSPAFATTPGSGCAPLSVFFTNQTPAVAGQVYVWDFDNGITSSLQTPPAQTFVNASNLVDSVFATELLVVSAQGCKDSVTHIITVRPQPLAQFTQDFDTACALDPVQFTNSSIGANTYAWNFDDGTTSNASNPSHLFPSFGIYDVSLVATSPFGCKDTMITTIVVDSIPVVDFTFSSVCLGDSTVFNNISTGGAIWTWNFGDGNTSNAQEPKHLYALNGNYTVTLIGLNPSGCGDTIQKTVYISPLPVANFTSSGNCETQNTSFTDISSASPTSWTWNFGDGGSSTTQNPSHSYALQGLYNVELIVENAYLCRDTLQQNIYIDSLPTASFTLANACMNDSVLFNNTTVFNADTFSWNFGDASISYLENPKHPYTSAGNYTVELIAGYDASQCFDTAIQTITIYQRSVPQFTYDSVCFGLTTAFHDASLHNPISWTWHFGDGGMASVQNPSYTYLGGSGNYSVQLITQTLEGCVDSVTQTVFVKHKPTAQFTNDSTCFGSPITLQDQSFANIVHWQWDMGNTVVLAPGPNFTYTYPDSGQYNIELIVTNALNCKDTAQSNTYVFPIPQAAFTFDTVCFMDSTHFVDTSVDGFSWNWSWNDGSGTVSTSQNPTHLFPLDGVYQVQLLVENGLSCKDSVTHPVWIKQKPFSGFYLNSVCAYDSSFFIDTTMHNPILWEWNFGDGSATSNLQNPSHVYAAGGNYNITLITQNALGCTDTLIRSITAYTTPSASFTADTSCLGNITHFNNTSTDIYPMVWSEWDFGDGNNSYAFSPDYIYQDTGLFNVSLLLINDKGCDTTIYAPVYVKYTPEASFTFDTVCVGNPTTFTANNSPGVSAWIWDFGDGSLDTVNTPITTHTYAQGGTYVAQLENTVSGCSDQAFGIITVVSDVVAQIHLDSAGYCLGESLVFMDASTTSFGTITNYYWDFGDGYYDSQQNPPHTYTSAGTYQVMLAVQTSIGCVDTVWQNVPLFDNPVADFIIDPVVTCQGKEITFTDNSNINSGSIVDYQWDYGDGNTGSGALSSHMYGSIGTYVSVLVVYSDQGCTDTLTQSLNIVESPSAAFNFTSTCSQDDTTYFTNTSTYGGTLVSWAWNFGDGQNSSLTDPEHYYNITADSIEVSLAVTADNGCVDTAYQTLYFLSPPILDFRAINAQGCAPYVASFEDNSYTTGGSSITSWLWDFGDGNFSFQENPSHSYTESGNYQVVLTAGNAYGCTATDTLLYPIIVHPAPEPAFEVYPPSEASIIDPDITLADLSLGADYLMWVIDAQDSIGGDSLAFYSFADTGWHQVTQYVINNYGCYSTLSKDFYVKPEFTFYLPNAFTPNKNAGNEVFIWQGIGVRSVRMVIWDKEGHIVFESYDKETPWKGQDAFGNPVKQDVYVYQVYVTDIFGDEHFYRGSVTLLR